MSISVIGKKETEYMCEDSFHYTFRIQINEERVKKEKKKHSQY